MPNDFMMNLLRIIDRPSIIARYILKKIHYGTLKQKIALDLFPRPHLAYCTYYAALSAKMLGIERISVIEFGVAGGSGLIELENISLEVEKETGIKIDVYGFDLGDGLPEHNDNNYDLPYIWKKGFYKMDIPKLRSKLKKAELIIGDVENTISEFINRFNPAPIGFISFDMDYYSSTKKSFKLFGNEYKYFLPRVFLYFDDMIGDDWELHSEFSGELLAIREFNNENPVRKIAKINGLSQKRVVKSEWNECIYAFHQFEHPSYSRYIYPDADQQLNL